MTKLEHIEGTWAKELPNILWSFQTTPSQAIGQILFNMVYGAEAVLSTKIGIKTARVSAYTPEGSATIRFSGRENNVDLLPDGAISNPN